SPDALAQTAQSLGFRNETNPLTQLPEGLKRKGEIRRDKAESEAATRDPQGYQRALFGARTDEDIAVDKTKPELARQDVAKGSIELQELERQQAELQTALEKFPDIADINVMEVAESVALE